MGIYMPQSQSTEIPSTFGTRMATEVGFCPFTTVYAHVIRKVSRSRSNVAFWHTSEAHQRGLSATSGAMQGWLGRPRLARERKAACLS
jgi:hypothetical protein